MRGRNKNILLLRQKGREIVDWHAFSRNYKELRKSIATKGQHMYKKTAIW